MFGELIADMGRHNNRDVEFWTRLSEKFILFHYGFPGNDLRDGPKELVSLLAKIMCRKSPFLLMQRITSAEPYDIERTSDNQHLS